MYWPNKSNEKKYQTQVMFHVEQNGFIKKTIGETRVANVNKNAKKK
jgi:hypothetical protein